VDDGDITFAYAVLPGPELLKRCVSIAESEPKIMAELLVGKHLRIPTIPGNSTRGGSPRFSPARPRARRLEGQPAFDPARLSDLIREPYTGRHEVHSVENSACQEPLEMRGWRPDTLKRPRESRVAAVAQVVKGKVIAGVESSPEGPNQVNRAR